MILRRHRPCRLALQGLIAHLPRHGLADLHRQLLDIDELSPPLGSMRPVDAIREVFRYAFDEMTQFVYLLGGNWLGGHPWLLSGLTAVAESDFSPSVQHAAAAMQTVSYTR